MNKSNRRKLVYLTDFLLFLEAMKMNVQIFNWCEVAKIVVKGFSSALMQHVPLNIPWLLPDTIICSTFFLHPLPPPQPTPSCPPPQPVAYLYPALSNEAINAPQSSSVGGNGRHKSDSHEAADLPPHLSLDGHAEGTLRPRLLDTRDRTWPHQRQPEINCPWRSAVED